MSLRKSLHRLSWLVLVLPLAGLSVGPVWHQPEAQARGQEKPAREITNSIGMVLVRIEPGKFAMGSPKTEMRRDDDGEQQHQVEISKAFYMGKFEVTQAEYQAVMGKNPSRFQGAKLPVETVSWQDAKEFCAKLSKKEDKEYTLPTEAEWEYACRAGTRGPFSFGATISTDEANYNGNRVYGAGKKGEYRKKTTEAGSFPANKWGLHDMHGNVWEWCEDWHQGDYYKTSPKIDPKGADKGEWRVLRGGSWEANPEDCRSANRAGEPPDGRHNHIGFRVVLRTLPN